MWFPKISAVVHKLFGVVLIVSPINDRAVKRVKSDRMEHVRQGDVN